MTGSPSSTSRRTLTSVACAALMSAGVLLSPMSTASATTSASGSDVRTGDGSSSVTARAARTRREIGEAAQRVARHQKGDPYQWGGVGPYKFDCSGLVLFAFKRAGLTVPRTSSAQAQASRRISRSEARAGDLAFFYDAGGVYHVGFYVGNDRVLHSPGTGKVVQTADIWTSKVFFGRLG